MILTDAASTGGSVGGGVGAGVGRGVETTGCGVGAGVATGVGEAVGEGVALAAEAGLALANDGGADWLLDCWPHAVNKNAAPIANPYGFMSASAEKSVGG